MSSQESSAGGVGGNRNPGVDESGLEPPRPNQPPFDLNNFPFTFEHIHDSSGPRLTRGLLSRDDDSITSSISAYREENGRTYHAYSDGSWHYPNDERELERLDWQFVCIKNLFVQNGKNYFAPWSKEHPPKRILDLATGTGLWAIEIAEEFESAIVVGTDLSPIQPELVPPNVHFYIHDARVNNWWWPEPFDYIHLRMTLGAWEDFEQDVARKSFDRLEPGGWFEAQELLSTIGCDDDSMTDDYPLKRLFDDLEDCSRIENRPIDIAKTYKQGLINAGFVDVTETVYKIPVNGWPRNKAYKTLGEMWNVNFVDGIQGIALALLHRARGLKRHQIEIHLMDVRRSISDKNVHAYQKFYVVVGRKPRADEMVTSTSGS
ncbi:tam domain protein [Xylariaceae sp. FL0662B]|nr:tam domain protein [Xylariaceae sp. FL0662B]